MNCSSTNGRINIMGPNINQFSLFDKIPINNECSTFHDAMTGNFQDSTLSLAFLAKKTCKSFKMPSEQGYTKFPTINT